MGDSGPAVAELPRNLAIGGARVHAVLEQTSTQARCEVVAQAVRTRRAQAQPSAGGAVHVSMQMATRPSPFAGAGATTADYVATVRMPDETKTVEGNLLGFSELTLRNEVVDRAAQEVVKLLVVQR